MKKVFLSIGAVLRDEGQYVAEWLTFHHLAGFDRFILVLHKCRDNTEEQIRRVKERLGLDIYIHHCKTDDKKIQMGTYQWIHQKYGRYTDWLLFLDGDEYVYHGNPSVNYREDIKALLRGFSKKVSAVSFHGKVFGPHRNIIRPLKRLSAYTTRLPLTASSCQAIKTFIRPEKMIEVLSPHVQRVRGAIVRFDGKPFTPVEGWKSLEPAIHWPICFNHYYTGSVEDWIARYNRGSCNDHRPNHAYSIDEFMFHANEMEYDDSILRYQYWHRALMEKLIDKTRFTAGAKRNA
jgi:hypothetical protein